VGADACSSNYDIVRHDADVALASDQFFWASAKPWWSLEMIEAGAFAALSVIEKIQNAMVPSLRVADEAIWALSKEEDLRHAQTLYRRIISTAFEWQRTGKIREMNKERFRALRIPFKERTYEVGGREREVYQAFVDMMCTQQLEAAKKGDYEKAILWRDSVYKIETKNDIYDAINAVDLLRMELSNEKVEEMLDRYTAQFRKIRGGQPEQRSN